MQANTTPAREPRRFGKYILLERIGRGGMAEVYRAKTYGAAGFVKECAIKKILSTLIDDNQFVRMFIDEAKLTARLTHANIVQVLDLGEIDGSLFIAMEYVAGKDLLDLLARAARRGIHFPIELTLTITSEILKGLDYAHAATGPRGEPMNIVHRDVSPSNVLIAYDGQVKVGDFGIAKSQMQSSHTEVGTQKGKTGYMSPEQVTGVLVDHRSDLFAVAVILFEMLTMTRLFKAKNDLDVMLKIRDGNISRELARARAVSMGLTEIIEKGLARNPDDRYQTAGEFLEELRVFAQDNRLSTSPRTVASLISELFAAEIAEEQERRNSDPEDLNEVESPHVDSRVPGLPTGRDWADLGAASPPRRALARPSQADTVERDLAGITPTGVGQRPLLTDNSERPDRGSSESTPVARSAPAEDSGDISTAAAATPAEPRETGGFAPAAILRNRSQIHVVRPSAVAPSSTPAPTSPARSGPNPSQAQDAKPSSPTSPTTTEGSIGAVSVVRLVHRIASRDLTGWLGVSQGGLNKTFAFLDGELVGADSDTESNDLVQSLVDHGELTARDATEIRAQAAGNHTDIENVILTAARDLAPHTLFARIQEQISEKLKKCLFWETGEWRWWEDPDIARDRFGTSIDVIELVTESIAESAEIRALRRYYKPRRRQRLVLLHDPDELAALPLSPRALRVIGNLDDAPHPAEIIRVFCDRFNWTEAEVYRTLFALTELEVLGFDGESAVQLPGD